MPLARHFGLMLISPLRAQDGEDGEVLPPVKNSKSFVSQLLEDGQCEHFWGVTEVDVLSHGMGSSRLANA